MRWSGYTSLKFEIGGQMRHVICCISVLVLGSSLVGCGQSGALQLPSDSNYDKRAKYLLYPKNTQINDIIFGVDKNKLYQLNISAFVAGALKYKNTINI